MNHLISSSELRWLLSVVFVFLGASVFFLSSLISGHNIYRDMDFRVAIMATGITGFLLFVFSPISYVVLTPAIYIKGWDVMVWNIERSGAREYLVMAIKKLHDLTLSVPYGILYAYLLSAVGLGLVFGCAQMIRPREGLLARLRRFANIPFSIYSYHSAWDDFLHSIKRGGEITITTKDKEEVTGSLSGFSVKKEPKEVILRSVTARRPRYGRGVEFTQEQAAPGAPAGDEQISMLVTKADDIHSITAPRRSFKRDRDVATPSSYAFYSTVMLLGVICLFFSADLTARFIRKGGFDLLAKAYFYLAFLMIAIYAFGVGWLVPRMLRRDFSSLYSALLIRPFFSSTLLFLVILLIGGLVFHWRIFLFVCNNDGQEVKVFDWASVLGCILVGICFGLYGSYLYARRGLKCQILAAINAIRDAAAKEKCGLSEYEILECIGKRLEAICDEQDLNWHGPGYFAYIIDELNKKATSAAPCINDTIASQVNNISRFSAGFSSPLGNEQFAIVDALRIEVEKLITKEGRNPTFPEGKKPQADPNVPLV